MIDINKSCDKFMKNGLQYGVSYDKLKKSIFEVSLLNIVGSGINIQKTSGG